METQKLKINDKEYLAYIARTDEEKERGLQNVEQLESDSEGREEGMLFIYDEPQHLDFWMQDCSLDLSIVFIDENGVVISNKHGIPNSEELVSEDNAQYVFECNVTTDINPGDTTSLGFNVDNLEVNKLYIIGEDGKPMYELQGGERIFSRKNTVTLISIAKRAFKSKNDSDYKRLGKKVFEYMKQQDEREPEYIEN